MRRPHDSEVIHVGATARCDTGVLVAYLGSLGGIDVLRPGVAAVSKKIDGQGVCIATFTPEETASARDALARPDHVRWRWCLDTKPRHKTVPCDELHETEVIAVRPAGDTDTDCRGAATQYTETNWRNLENTFTAKRVESEGQVQCRLTSLGDTHIYDTLRAIGTRALPVGSRRTRKPARTDPVAVLIRPSVPEDAVDLPADRIELRDTRGGGAPARRHDRDRVVVAGILDVAQ